MHRLISYLNYYNLVKCIGSLQLIIYVYVKSSVIENLKRENKRIESNDQDTKYMVYSRYSIHIMRMVSSYLILLEYDDRMKVKKCNLPQVGCIPEPG